VQAGFTSELISVDDGLAVVAVRGELDRVTTDELKHCVRSALDQGATHLCVDLLEVSYMDSSGFGPMIEAHHRLAGVNGAVTVACRELFCEIFEVTGLDSVFRLHHSREDALAYMTDVKSARR
jgi:anti-sigma B factor antagonist